VRGRWDDEGVSFGIGSEGVGGAGSADPGMPDMPSDPVRTRGRYAFTLDGAPAGIDERFVVGDIAPGVVRARTTRVMSRPVARLETDVRIDPVGVSAAVRWVGSAAGAARDASADLHQDPTGVSASRVVEGTAYAVTELPGLLNTLAHVVSGPLMLAALGGADVVEPDLLAPDDPASFLAAIATRWTTTEAGPAVVSVDGVDHDGTSYLWSDARTGVDAHLVVDAGGLLLRSRLTAPDGLLEVVLTEVTGPWPVPSDWFGA
jgi:hypothetical protein